MSIAEDGFGCEGKCGERRSVPHLYLLLWKSREFADFVEGFQEDILVWKIVGIS